ncbi:MAG TPA: glycoside hydrolase family 2 TIM barrel-domain containing protein, partial [Planctomycetota bacterium]|nr:glycoside hydrolase family 2 TIM barrel-domain containing protein [Planctomycetota bacterium]
DEVAALSREFAVPEAMRGQRLKLRFGSVKFNSTVLVNGKQVATHFGGYEPFEVDVTDAVSVEKPNQLAVRCHTWAGVMTDGPKQFSKAGGWDQVRSAPRDRILAPIGGLYGLYGIWDDVTLVSHPAVYIKDLFIKPSVRRSELVVDYTLANESEADAEVELSAVVEEAVTLSKTTVKVPAGKTATVSLKAPWPKPRLWSHADPHLYALKSQIANRKSQINDEVVTRFGFREFWCQGPDFYLNGSKMHLLASSGWPPHGPQTREEIAAFWNGLKACGCVAFRTHTQPWPAAYYDVADELGLLVIPEGAVWNDDDVYRVNDPAFWDNYAAHLAAMVGSLKNHPSVVMWSLENEFTGGRVNDNTPYPKEQLIRLGKLVKQLDPTRPIMYESDGDPGGVADVIGIHYPHEYPDYTCWPNEGYWLDKPSPGSGGGGIFLNGEKQFLWKRDKPLYIGEFLWVPSSDPAPHTIFFGDDAYRDYHLYRNLAKAEAWKMQILAYRVQGVSGICPWTVTEGGPLDDTNALWRAHKWAYQPIAAYCLDYDSRFYAGEKVTRRIAIFSDILEPSKLTLSWTLSLGGKTVAEGSEKVELGPAGQQGLNVTVPMPSVDERTPAQWRVTLDRDGRRAFDETHAYAVFPRPTLPKLAARIGLYDPKGATRKLFESNDLAAAPVEALDKLPAGLDVLVIGAGAFAAEKAGGPVIGRVDPRRAALDTFTAQGGRVLVLEQQAYPEGLFGFGLTSHSSTMAFPLQSDHPILHGLALGPGGLRFWRGDNLVAEREPTRPASGAFCPIIVSGSAAGLDHAPLLQRFVGRGCIVHAQLKLVEKFTAEPIAAQLLGRLLTFLAEYRPKERRTAVAGGSPDYRACLRRLGLRFDDLTGRLAGADLSRYSLLICRGDVRDADRILQFIRQGGAVLAHRLSPEAFQELRRAFGLDLTLAHYSGIASRADTDPLGFLAREDLYWLGEHRGISWPRRRGRGTWPTPCSASRSTRRRPRATRSRAGRFRAESSSGARTTWSSPRSARPLARSSSPRTASTSSASWDAGPRVTATTPLRRSRWMAERSAPCRWIRLRFAPARRLARWPKGGTRSLSPSPTTRAIRRRARTAISSWTSSSSPATRRKAISSSSPRRPPLPVFPGARACLFWTSCAGTRRSGTRGRRRDMPQRCSRPSAATSPTAQAGPSSARRCRPSPTWAGSAQTTQRRISRATAGSRRPSRSPSRDATRWSSWPAARPPRASTPTWKSALTARRRARCSSRAAGSAPIPSPLTCPLASTSWRCGSRMT